MNRFFGTLLVIALAGCVWNVVALIMHLLFNVHLPAIDPGY